MFGGLVVLLELPVRLTVLHFITGLAIFLLTSYMAAFDGENVSPRFPVSGYAGLFLAMEILIFSQASLGSYVRHAGAGLACPEFPTCLGRWLPLQMGHEVLIHYSHRFLALLIIFTLVALAMAAFLDGKLRRHRPLVYSLLFLAVLQIGAGAGVVETGLNFAATAFHLAIALVMLLVLGRMWVLESSG